MFGTKKQTEACFFRVSTKRPYFERPNAHLEMKKPLFSGFSEEILLKLQGN
jgi:hypothetical protein